MSRTLVFVFLLFVGLNCQRPRIRHPGEIVPVSVEKSDTTDTGTEDGSAVVDLDFSTKISAKGAKNRTAWLKLTFDKLYCISFVTRFNDDTIIKQSYSCTNDRCYCAGKNCHFMEEPSVESDREDTKSLPVMPHCKYGSSVTLQFKSGHSSDLKIAELAVFGNSVVYTGNSVSADSSSTSRISCPPGSTVNKTKCDFSFLSAIPEPILWSVLGFFILICTILVILLVQKCSRESCCCCCCDTADYESGYIKNEVESLALTTITNKDMHQAGNVDNAALKPAGNIDNAALKPAGNIDNAALKPAGNIDNAALKQAGNIDNAALKPARSIDNAALKPNCALPQVPTFLPSTPAPACTVHDSSSSPEPDYINTTDMMIYEELN